MIVRAKKIKKGLNFLLSEGNETGICFSLCILDAGQSININTSKFETLFLVLRGKGLIIADDKKINFDRNNFWDFDPVSLHVSCKSNVRIFSSGEAEVAVIQIANRHTFPMKYYHADEMRTEHRCKGMQEDTAYRIVRTICDLSNAPEKSRLVAGEVINFQGKWSSYPPHHHVQPEIYYYRFEPEYGYGHAELGENVFKVYNNDISCITEKKDHSQVSAPGYKMYYIWAIRHIRGNPYKGFEYNEIHRKNFFHIGACSCLK
jgi:5-deoxy-glucuronate isomerase